VTTTLARLVADGAATAAPLLGGSTDAVLEEVGA
jgi:hypothetical protein